jgi:hypothetical protein
LERPDCCLAREAAASGKSPTEPRSSRVQIGGRNKFLGAEFGAEETGFSSRSFSMKQFVIAAVGLTLFAGAALAQNYGTAPAPAPSSTPAPAAAPAPAMATDAKPTAKAARAQCKADAKAQGLKGDARKTAQEDCFAKARPDLVAAEKCRKDGKDKNLAGKELKAYVKQCVASAG